MRVPHLRFLKVGSYVPARPVLRARAQ